MRTRTANWFETAVRYERQMEDGLQKMVTETYVVDAFTFGEAEEAITKEMTAFVSGEFNVKNITPPTTAKSSSATTPTMTSGTRQNSHSSL